MKCRAASRLAKGRCLLVDATQGVQAQTIANVNLAMANNLTIIPVINKIDLASADVEGTKQSISEVLHAGCQRCLAGQRERRTAACRRCWRRSLRGFLRRPGIRSSAQGAHFRFLVRQLSRGDRADAIVDGAVRPGMKIKVMSNDRMFEVTEVGQFTPKRTKRTELLTGEVGYLCANMREVADVKIGDTLTDALRPTEQRLSGYKEVKPLVFCGLYSTDTARYEDLRDALREAAVERLLVRL